ncbi:MAG TPA: GGDEF domain-containing protein [Natronincola sp.]|nr:GGDEF domain-containing protein [Natronincola sp.]
MGERKLPKCYVVTVSGITIINLAMLYSYSSAIPWDDWFLLLNFFFLTILLQSISARLTHRISFTLATTTIFPIIYSLGVTPAAIVALIIGLIDGILNKKYWLRIVFNMSQLSLCTVVGAVVFNQLGGSSVPIMYKGLIALSLGIATQMIVNILLVSLLASILTGISWGRQLRQFGMAGFFNVMEKALASLIFTLLVSSYGFWGIIAFGLLLIHLSDLLGASSKISNERMMQFELEQALLIDELTTAYNFRFLNNWLNEPKSDKMAVIFMDIDNFGYYNELYGHQQGDEILHMITKIVKKSIRDKDKVIRYGGDEFIVLLPKLDTKNAVVIGERILQNLEDFMIISANQPLTVSMGIAVAKEANVDKQQLITVADEAMYKAKQSGKSTLRFKEISV